jgi:carboxymethylenebutenolidase
VTDIAVPYFLARPAADPPWPGAVVVPEGNGMSPQLLRVCQRLAREGYAAAAPDIFWRLGGSDPARSLQELATMRMRDLVQDVSDCVDVLRAAGASKVGVTGFCLGGRITYAAAMSPAVVIDAAAPFYGAGIDKLLGSATCPMLLFYGGRDEYIAAEEIERVRAHHRDADVVVYPDAEHGFMRNGSKSYSEPAATDAWSRLLTFFGTHLGAQ